MWWGIDDGRSCNENDGRPTPGPVVPVGRATADYARFAGCSGNAVFDDSNGGDGIMPFVVIMTDFEGGSKIVSRHDSRDEAEFAAREFWNGRAHDAASVHVEDLR